ncbi:MAG: N-6 DNA methylase, partial [Rickettsia aeschlimannii]
TYFYWGDTLNHLALLENDKLMEFDIVVANPPFSLEKLGHENAANDEYNRFKCSIPPKSKGDYAFILHMIKTTKLQSGRAAIYYSSTARRIISWGKRRFNSSEFNRR